MAGGRVGACPTNTHDRTCSTLSSWWLTACTAPCSRTSSAPWRVPEHTGRCEANNTLEPWCTHTRGSRGTRTRRADHVHVPRRRHLHGCQADRPGRTVDQHPFTGDRTCFVDQRAVCSGHRNSQCSALAGCLVLYHAAVSGSVAQTPCTRAACVYVPHCRVGHTHSHLQRGSEWRTCQSTLSRRRHGHPPGVVRTITPPSGSASSVLIATPCPRHSPSRGVHRRPQRQQHLRHRFRACTGAGASRCACRCGCTRRAG